MGDYGLELFKASETSFVAANRLFYLEPSTVRVDDSKTIEEFDIPSLVWNEVFDSSIVTAKWEIRGKFAAADTAWSGAPNFTGRGFDFMHRLRSLLKGIDQSTGDPPSGSDLEQLIMVISRNSNESFNSSSRYSANAIYVVADRFSFDLKGGITNIVDYSITFKEVSGVIRI